MHVLLQDHAALLRYEYVLHHLVDMGEWCLIFLVHTAPDGLDTDFQHISKNGDRVTGQTFFRRRNYSAELRSFKEMFGD